MAWAAYMAKTYYDAGQAVGSGNYGASGKAKSQQGGDPGDDAFNAANSLKDEAYDTRDSAGFRSALAGYAQGIPGRKAPQTGPASTFGPAWANAAHIDTNMSDADRAKQEQALAMLAAQAQGKGPSVATQQMKANVDAANAANMAFAGSARGRINPMLAARQAMASNSANLQAGARDSAMLRTQEQIAGQNAYAQMLAGVRGQDMTGAQAQAQLNQQAGLANAGFQQQASMFGADAQNKVALANLEAKLKQEGYNDAQISNVLSMEENQLQAEKATKMAAWGGLLQNSQFSANLAQQRSMYDQNRKDAQYAAWGQALAQGVGSYAGAGGGGGGAGTAAASGTDSLASYYDSSGL